jgi:hypothetical protein
MMTSNERGRMMRILVKPNFEKEDLKELSNQTNELVYSYEGLIPPPSPTPIPYPNTGTSSGTGGSSTSTTIDGSKH